MQHQQQQPPSSAIPLQSLTEINDIRSPAQFRSITFSNFKRTEVKTKLLENMKIEKVEPACYWTAELICAGHYNDIWEIILHYLGKYIYLANPKMIFYLENRYKIFNTIVSQRHYNIELDLRNNERIRKLFTEVITILTISSKKTGIELLKINFTENYFNIEHLHERCKAPSVNYATAVFKKKDPQEFFIALNEFAYNVSTDSKNVADACYWLEWIIEFNNHCNRQKMKCAIERRHDYPVESAYQRDIIWLIWDIFFINCGETGLLSKYVASLLQIFCINYTSAANKRRRYLLYLCITLIIESRQLEERQNVELILNKSLVETVLTNIDDVYKQIKKNEQSPNMDYLYSGIDDSAQNLNETIRKMNIIDTL